MSATLRSAPMADIPPVAFSVPQVAARWGVSSRQIYDLCARGELGHLRIGGLIRIRIADLEAYEARQWRAPVSAPQITDSPNADVISMHAGGKRGNGSAFQRGQQTAAKQQSSSRSS